MGCGTVTHKASENIEHQVALRPYPDDINGINDKVANSFNTFLKSNGANPKPLYKDRPKLNFELKDPKPQKHQSAVMPFPNSDIAETVNLFQMQTNDLFLSSISEKNSLDMSKNFDKKSFVLTVPQEFVINEFNPSEPGKARFSISIHAEEQFEELNELENEANDITSKYF